MSDVLEAFATLLCLVAVAGAVLLVVRLVVGIIAPTVLDPPSESDEWEGRDE